MASWFQRLLAGAFFQGLFRPSLLSTGVMAVVTMLLFALPASYFTAAVDTYIRYFPPRDGRESRVETDAIAQQFAQRKNDARHLIIIGASTTRESLSSEQELEAQILAAGGEPEKAVLLSAPGMAVLELVAYSDRITDHVDGRLVYAVSPSRMSQDLALSRQLANAPRVGFASQRFNNELLRVGIAPPKHYGFYTFDYAGYVITAYRAARLRVAATLLNPRTNYTKLLKGNARERTYRQGRHWFRPEDFTGLDDWKYQMQKIKDRISGYAENVDRNLALLSRLVDDVHKRNAKLTVELLEAPVNPHTIRDAFGQEFYHAYIARMREFARTKGIAYHFLNEAAALKPADFADWGHLKSPEARRRYTREMARAFTLTAGQKGLSLTTPTPQQEEQ